MQTDQHRHTAEEILTKFGEREASPLLWARDPTRHPDLQYSPHPWVEKAIAAAVLLTGDEGVRHARVLRPSEEAVRLVILTDTLLIVSAVLRPEDQVAPIAMTAVPRRAIRSIDVVAEEGVIVRGSVIAGADGYVTRQPRTWPGVVSCSASYEGFGVVSIVGPGEESDPASVSGFVSALRDDLSASR